MHGGATDRGARTAWIMDGHGDEETHLSSLSYMAQTRSRNSTSVSGVPMLISAAVGVDDRFRGAGVGATRVCAAIGSCMSYSYLHNHTEDNRVNEWWL